MAMEALSARVKSETASKATLWPGGTVKFLNTSAITDVSAARGKVCLRCTFVAGSDAPACFCSAHSGSSKGKTNASLHMEEVPFVAFLISPRKSHYWTDALSDASGTIFHSGEERVRVRNGK